MSEKVYDLHAGDVFTAYGCGFSWNDVFRVESIVNDIAFCRQENSRSQLMLPLNAGMPFAIRVYADGMIPPKAAQPFKPQFVRVPAPAAAPEQPQAKEEAEAPAEEPQTPAAAEPAAPVRVESVIDYYRPVENWGKVHVDGIQQGMFFHITQVEDNELRAFLAKLTVGSKVPNLKVSYIASRNPNHHNSICAGAIRAEEKLPEAVAVEPVAEVEHTGFISEQESSGALLLLENEQTYRTKAITDIDPELKAYLQNYAATGSLDTHDLEVKFTTSGRLVLRVEWINREKVLEEKGISLEGMVSEEEKAAWAKKEEAPAEQPAAERKEVVVPAYQELPVWVSDYGNH